MLHAIAWIIFGGIAGWITGKLTLGPGFGSLVDMAAGAVGGIFGGTVSHHMGLGFGRRGLVATLAMVVVGAVVLAWLVRLFSRDRRPGSL